MDTTQIKQKRTREANYINLTDQGLKSEIKELITLPNKDLHMNYVLWYKKDTQDEWGLTIKGFPDKKYGTQHVFKVTWFADKDEDGEIRKLKPANHCASQTEEIVGQPFDKILNIYLKYKK
jgi:hypothetical protein